MKAESQAENVGSVRILDRDSEELMGKAAQQLENVPMVTHVEVSDERVLLNLLAATRIWRAW